jgi:hypothetical protein
MNTAALIALGLKVWPAVVGVATAVVYVSKSDYPSAFNAFVAGLAGAHILHQTAPPAGAAVEPAPKP